MRLPADFDAALHEDNFYTFSVSEDAAFGKTADLAIAKPAGADWSSRRSAASPRTSAEPAPGNRRDVAEGRPLYIADQVAKTAIGKIDACEAIWTAATKKSDELKSAYQKSGAKNEKLFDDGTKAEDDGDKAYRACLVAKTPQQPYYAALVKEAQEIADRLAAK